jgi:hypothetical protein
METDLASPEPDKIGLSFQGGFFYTDPGRARVDIALAFPWNRLKHEWKNATLRATIGVLGMVYKKDGTLAARFSDVACCPSERPDVVVSGDPSYTNYGEWDPVCLPARYNAQFDLPPGEYDFRLVLSDGSKFGRVEMPLIIDSYDGKQLALSSVVLCKRFRDASVVAQEAAAANLAPKYEPLVSKGVQVTPTAGTRFKRGEPLIAYFEVYEPRVAAQPATAVHAHLRIVDAKTGEIAKDFQPVDAASYKQAGKLMIPVAREIATDKLPQGAYRLEVQASDSAGKSTVWRTANFTVE